MMQQEPLVDIPADPDSNSRATDPAVFAELHRRFAFTVDVAAAHDNAKLPRYFTREMDGIRESWLHERVWCNPPYATIEPWVAKAWTSGADLVVMLVPANRTDQAWWHQWIEGRRDRPGSPLRVEFIRGRMRFLMTPNCGVPRPIVSDPCCLLIWDFT